MRCSRRWRGAEALTLIEILASLALLGSLLAAMLLARGQMAHQWRAAQEKLEAVEAADRLLEDWWVSGPVGVSGVAGVAGVPRHDQGEIKDTDLHWRTEPLSVQPLEDLEVEVIRLEVFNPRLRAEVLVSVELIAPAATAVKHEHEGAHVAFR